MSNLKEFLKITIKQHYIPRVYLQHFKTKNSKKTNMEIRTYNKLDKSEKIEKIDDIFYENFLYTNMDKYYRILFQLKNILENRYKNIYQDILDLLKKQEEKYEALFFEYEKEIRDPLKNYLKKEVYRVYKREKRCSCWNILTFNDKVDEIYTSYLTNLIKLSIFGIIELFKISLNTYMLNSIKEIKKFLKEKDKIFLEKNNKKISDSFYRLVSELNSINTLNHGKINELRKKIKILKEKKSYTELEKKYGEKFDQITKNCIQNLNTIWVKNLINELKKYKNTAPLEDTLSSFENSCIFSINSKKKEIFQKDKDLNDLSLKQDFLFNLSKYLLIQYYRYPYSKKRYKCLLKKIIVDYSNYKDIKNSNICPFVKLKGILIEIDYPFFITSDNPIFIDSESNLLIFTLSPNLIYLIVGELTNTCKYDFWQLKYQNHKNFIQNINYFIFKNSIHKIILSNENNLNIDNELFKEISSKEFLETFETLLDFRK
ncbi:MAG: DUF4238 domain-containing protein [Fusobacterium gastrosuis]|uniref:DUF4238 domain-containing protein n=1 Tax=Fusobacterium gastrosuis TaxID=1755100 RepID=UPI002A8FB873|nr:DUF4238 domain-containing protein [Fusobacterium gastrosuis]